MIRSVVLISLLMASSAIGQELTPPDDLAANVRDIAALSVRNSDGLEALRAKVAGLTKDRDSMRSRLDHLEAKVFAVQAPSVVEYSAPVEVWQPAPVLTPQVVYEAPIVTTRTKTVTRGRTGPIRGFFRCLFLRRMTVNRGNSSNYIYPPTGIDIYSHLEGPPHYVSNARSLSYDQALTLHTRLH